MSLAMFTQAQAMLAALRGEIISLKQRVRTTLVGIATGVFSIVSGFFARIADAVGTAFETVHKMADAVANGVRKLVDIALAAVGAMVSTVRSTVSEIIDALP
jgi:phage-related protein